MKEREATAQLLAKIKTDSFNQTEGLSIENSEFSVLIKEAEDVMKSYKSKIENLEGTLSVYKDEITTMNLCLEEKKQLIS